MSITFLNIKKLIDTKEMMIIKNPDKVLDNFRSLSVLKKLSPNYLYALKASNLKKYKNSLDYMNLILYEDTPLPADFYQLNGLNAVITKNADTFQEIKLQIQDMFDTQARISNHAYELMALCHSGADVQTLLTCGYRFLNNPLLLLNTSFTLSTQVGVYSEIEEPLISSCLKEGQLPAEFLRDIITEHFPAIDPDHPDILILEKGCKPYIQTTIIMGRILRGNHLAGYLHLYEYHHPLSDEDKSIFTILCKFLSITLTNLSPRISLGNMQVEDFFSDILSQRITSESAIESRANLYNLANCQDYLLISISYDVQKCSIDRLYFLQKQLQGMFTTPCCILFHDLIVLTIPQKEYQRNTQLMEHFLSSNHLTAGISLPFQSFSKLYKRYKQTLVCLEMASSFSLKENMILYDDWKLVHLFYNIQDYCDLEDLIPSSIRELQAMDIKRGTNLMETLFVYLRHSQNIANAASELHLHYNTMKYRLNQISELCSIDFDDPETTFQILIAEKVMRIIDKNFS